MRVLITGAAGFIGSHLAERLDEDGHEVFGVDNYETGRRDNFDCLELDIVNRHDLYQAANDLEPELVIHCAASYKNPDRWHQDIDTNVTGTVNATLVAQHHNARLVYFQTALPPLSSYAISKIAGEKYIHLSNVPALVFRLANIYGPRNLSGPIPTFYRRLSNGEPCTVVDTSRDLVFVDDLVHCVIQALEQDKTGVYDVCTGVPTPIRDLYWSIAARLGIDTPPTSYLPGAGDIPTVLDPLKRLPGWKARVPFHEGMRTTLDWYDQHPVDETYTHLKTVS